MSQKPAETPPDGPARLRPEHVQDQALGLQIGAPKGFRVLDTSPLGAAYEQGRLDDPEPHKSPKNAFSADHRYTAVRDYIELYEIAEIRTGKDSTNLDIVSGGGGYPVTEAKADALKKLIAIKTHMPESDRVIVQKLADGYSFAEAVREAEGRRYRFEVPARVRTALDNLIWAMIRAKKSNYRFEFQTTP